MSCWCSKLIWLNALKVTLAARRSFGKIGEANCSHPEKRFRLRSRDSLWEHPIYTDMERAIIETFVAGHTTTILDRLHQILASSREQTPHEVLHRFAPYTARAMTARLAEAFAAAVAKDAFRFSESATCLNAGPP